MKGHREPNWPPKERRRAFVNGQVRLSNRGQARFIRLNANTKAVNNHNYAREVWAYLTKEVKK